MHVICLRRGKTVCQPEDGGRLDLEVAFARNVGRLAVTLPLARRRRVQPHRPVRADGEDVCIKAAATG